MNIFDPNNPRHREILREEIVRAKRIIAEEENPERGTDSWATTTIASKDPQFGRVLYRGATDIMRRDPENESKYNALLAAYLRHIGKAAMEDMTVREMENFWDKLVAFKNRINPPHQYDPNVSALDADSYRAGRGRDGYQGD